MAQRARWQHRESLLRWNALDAHPNAMYNAVVAEHLAAYLSGFLAGVGWLVLVEGFASNAQRNPKGRFQRMNHALPPHPPSNRSFELD